MRQSTAVLHATVAVQLTIPVAALIGWLTHTEALTSFGLASSTMKPITASAFIALGVALVVERKRQQQPRRAALTLVRNASLVVPCAVAAIATLEYLGQVPAWLNQALLFGASRDVSGRLSQMTIVGFLLAAASVWCSALPPPRRLYHLTLLALATLAWFSTLALLLSGRLLDNLGWFQTYSLPTAICFFAFTAGALNLHPRAGILGLLRSPSAGGVTARSLLPLAAIGSTLLGKVHVELLDAGWIDPAAAIALFSTLASLGVAALTLHGGRRLDAAGVDKRVFEGIFNSMFQLTWLVDADGRIREANKTALEFAGVTPEAVAGKPLAEAPWWESSSARDQLRRSLEKASQGRFVRYVTRAKGPDAVGVPLDLSIKPLSESGREVETLIVEGRDVGEAEEARAALIESEARFRNALDYSAIGFALVDLDGKWIRVNAALCQILGRTQEQLLRSTFQEITYPDDLEQDWKFAQELVAGQRSHYHMEKRYLLPDGSVVWCLLSGSLVRSTDGTPQYFVAQVQDISERKSFEAHIQDALREKEVMLREIHHRVNNNLQIVSSILRLGRGTITDSALVSLFEETESRVRSMALVHELLYRSEQLALVDFGVQLRSLCDLVRRTWSAPDKQLQVHISAATVALDMDTAIPLGLIAHELVSNALKHAFVERDRGNVWIVLEQTECGVLLRVSDDGVGLPDGFTPGRGRSLGMRIVTRLTEQLRGRLDFVSNGGAVFTVEAPLPALVESAQREGGAT